MILDLRRPYLGATNLTPLSRQAGEQAPHHPQVGSAFQFVPGEQAAAAGPRGRDELGVGGGWRWLEEKERRSAAVNKLLW